MYRKIWCIMYFSEGILSIFKLICFWINLDYIILWHTVYYYGIMCVSHVCVMYLSLYEIQIIHVCFYFTYGVCLQMYMLSGIINICILIMHTFVNCGEKEICVLSSNNNDVPYPMYIPLRKILFPYNTVICLIMRLWFDCGTTDISVLTVLYIITVLKK